MKVGFVGLGKMGLPLAVAIASRGHDVMGYDLDSGRMTHNPQPYQETGPDGKSDFNDHLRGSRVRFGSLHEVLAHAELVFLAVQTPHEPEYEGITRLPDERVDFDYSYLVEAARAIAPEIQCPLVVMSTVLPGTMRREIIPLLGVPLVYNPSFIAMGTTMQDYLDPEFILIGSDDTEARDKVEAFYATITDAPCRTMAVESAELTKVAYNTLISLKIIAANNVMEICEHFPRADCDEVTSALQAAHRRVVSPAYMTGGMGDGGGCHPRDCIALSALARKLHLSFDLFESVMVCREMQAEWLAMVVAKHSVVSGLPVKILGKEFKPETNLTVGSPAILVGNLLRQMDTDVEYVDTADAPAVYLVGCKHCRYKNMRFARGSVVVDPHRYIPDQRGVTVVRLGECR